MSSRTRSDARAARRLTVFIHSMGAGGAERVAANLVNHWAERGWRITLVTLAPRSVDFYALHPAVERVALDLAGRSGNALVGLWQNLRRARAYRRVLRERDPEVALALMTGANVLLALARLGLPTRAVGSEHIHPPHFPLGPFWERLRRWTYGQLDAVTALTTPSAAWLKAHTRARRVPIVPNSALWPLPVGEPWVPPAGACPPGRRILLAVGRLERQKGFDLLVEAFGRLAASRPEWDLVIVGEGSLRAALERQVAAAGLGARIRLPGRVGNLGEWYERADLFVMSSRFEGFGNTLAEALAHGVPAVSFDCETGPSDIVRNGVDGLLVPAGDVQALSQALARVTGDDALRAGLAARAADARERFSVARIAGLWEDVFDEALRSPR